MSFAQSAPAKNFANDSTLTATQATRPSTVPKPTSRMALDAAIHDSGSSSLNKGASSFALVAIFLCPGVAQDEKAKATMACAPVAAAGLTAAAAAMDPVVACI